MAEECLALLRKVGRLAKEKAVAGASAGAGAATGDGNQAEFEQMKHELQHLHKILEGKLTPLQRFNCKMRKLSFEKRRSSLENGSRKWLTKRGDLNLLQMKSWKSSEYKKRSTKRKGINEATRR